MSISFEYLRNSQSITLSDIKELDKNEKFDEKLFLEPEEIKEPFGPLKQLKFNLSEGVRDYISPHGLKTVLGCSGEPGDYNLLYNGLPDTIQSWNAVVKAMQCRHKHSYTVVDPGNVYAKQGWVTTCNHCPAIRYYNETKDLYCSWSVVKEWTYFCRHWDTKPIGCYGGATFYSCFKCIATIQQGEVQPFTVEPPAHLSKHMMINYNPDGSKTTSCSKCTAKGTNLKWI